MNNTNKDKTVLIIDYGVGNLLSITKALDYLGYSYGVSNTVDDIVRYQSYILPGVGAFGEAMRNINLLGISEALCHEVKIQKKPILGICLGMQLFAKSSTEDGHHKGLCLIEGSVEKINPNPENLKVPHVGWNEIIYNNNNPLFKNIDKNSCFYYDHSYHFICDSKYKIASCVYGNELTVAINHDNIYGFQFHPEKSHVSGLKLLRNYFNHIGKLNA